MSLLTATTNYNIYSVLQYSDHSISHLEITGPFVKCFKNTGSPDKYSVDQKTSG